MVIDCHSHWYPPVFFEALLNRKSYPRAERDGQGGYVLKLAPQSSLGVERHMVELDLILERMARAGIDVLVSSSAPLALVDSFPPDEAGELALLLNEEQAKAGRSHPDRYLGLATLPMQDPARALEVLDDAVGRLGLRGVCIGSNINGRPISSEECWPVYRRLEQLDVPLFLHPTSSIMRDRLEDFGLEYVVGFKGHAVWRRQHREPRKEAGDHVAMQLHVMHVSRRHLVGRGRHNRIEIAECNDLNARCRRTWCIVFQRGDGEESEGGHR